MGFGTLDTIRRRFRSEGGYTMPELLIGALLGLAMIGSAVAVFTTGIRAEPRIADRSAKIQEARVLAESVAREIRQGSIIPTATPTQISLVTFVKRPACGTAGSGNAVSCRVNYTCEAGTCLRTVAEPDGTGAAPPVQVVEGLADSNVFTYYPDAVDPGFVGIRFSFPAEAGEDAITVTDGVSLRNLSPPPAPGA